MMKSSQFFWMMVMAIICITSSSVLCHSTNELQDNEISSEGRSTTSDSDPSFLDEILGPDYFEEMQDSDNNNDKTKNLANSQSKLVAEDGSVIEPIVVTEKPFCTGCPLDVNPEDQKIKDIGTFAFNTYSLNRVDGDDGDEAPAQTFIRVIKAQTQVVAGYKYILKMELGYLNCSKSFYSQHPELCVVDNSKETVTCDFEVIEQAWMNKKEVIKSECSDTQVVDDDDNNNKENQEGLENFPMEDFQYEFDGDYPTTSSPLPPDSESTSRRKRDTLDSSSFLGKPREAEDNKETLMELGKFAVAQLDTIDEDDEARLVIEVMNVKKQTVSGWLYHLKLRVAQTSCKEGEEVTYEKCKDKIELPFMICNVKVLFQPWQTVQKKVTESQCFPEKMKRSKKIARKLFGDDSESDNEKQNLIKKKKSKKHNRKLNDIDHQEEPLIGAPKQIDTSSPELQLVLDYAMEKVDQQSNAMHAQKLVKIHDASRQIVDGILIKMTIETGYTNCRKSPDLDKSKCDIDEKREHQFCKISVWEKPWLNQKKITESKCGKSEEIMKRKKRDTTSQNTVDLTNIDQVEEEFGSFVQKYEKTYKNEGEYRYRLSIFRENMKKVKYLQETEQGTGIYGATLFADLTEEEFSERHLGLRPDLKQRSRVKKAKIPALTKIPNEFDWRHYNAVTPVKNQGSCGSCWAFSVTGNIEGLYARKHNKLLSFSEQELVDCDTLDSGCGGGLPENAYKSLQKIGGLEEESAYPYDGKNEKCHFKSDLATAQVTGFVEMPKNETQMAAWLVKNGPISIGINANAMQFYFGGVSHPFKFLCSPKQLDHGVLIVGYGVYTTTYLHKVLPYWIVKNSWGPHWGEKGYYRIFRGDGSCGINQMATSAVIA